MAQHDYVIANGTGAAVRSDLNSALAAIVSNNSGATEPTPTYAYQWWPDTTTGNLKLRNGANNAWITIGPLATTGFGFLSSGGTLTAALGSASTPGITFTGDTNTGIYSPGADQVAISSSGVGRVFVDASGRVGVGTSSPNSTLDVRGIVNLGDPAVSGSARKHFVFTGGGVTSDTANGLTFKPGSASTTDQFVRFETGGGTLVGAVGAVADGLSVWTRDTSNALTITQAGRLGIGSTPSYKLDVEGTIRSGSSGSPGSIILTASGATEAGWMSVGPFNWHGGSDFAIGAGTSKALLLGSNNAERARIDTSGRLLVGTSSSPTNGSSQYALLRSRGNTFSSTTWGGISLGCGTAATSITSGAEIGYIFFTDSAGNDFANIGCIADANAGNNDFPGRLVFSTTADGASSPTERFRIACGGDVVVFNSPAFKPQTDNAVLLGVSGGRWSAVWAANGTIQTSDERAKSDITTSTLGADFIKSLRPVSYKWIEGGKRDTGKRDENNNHIYESVPGERTHWGFIAQEVKQAVDAVGVDFGGWVLTDKDDPDSQQALRYDQFIAPLTKALQEALAEIDVLKAKVAALESA